MYYSMLLLPVGDTHAKRNRGKNKKINYHLTTYFTIEPGGLIQSHPIIRTHSRKHYFSIIYQENLHYIGTLIERDFKL